MREREGEVREREGEIRENEGSTVVGVDNA